MYDHIMSLNVLYWKLEILSISWHKNRILNGLSQLVKSIPTFYWANRSVIPLHKSELSTRYTSYQICILSSKRFYTVYYYTVTRIPFTSYCFVIIYCLLADIIYTLRMVSLPKIILLLYAECNDDESSVFGFPVHAAYEVWSKNIF